MKPHPIPHLWQMKWRLSKTPFLLTKPLFDRQLLAGIEPGLSKKYQLILDEYNNCSIIIGILARSGERSAASIRGNDFRRVEVFLDNPRGVF